GRAARGCPAGSARRGRACDHAGRVVAARPPRGRPPAPGRARPAHRRGEGGCLRGPRRREVHLHRDARHVPDRTGAPGRRPRGRPVLGAHRRLGPRGQDPDGRPGGRPARVRASLADRRHARRRRARHRAGGGRARGGGVRRGARRDRGRRPVRGHGRRHGRHVLLPHPRADRRPAAGDQEGHPRARRRGGGEQGRRVARARRPPRRGRAGRRPADDDPRARRLAPAGAAVQRADRGRAGRGVGGRGPPPRRPGRGRIARPAAGGPAGGVDVGDGPRPDDGPAHLRPRGQGRAAGAGARRARRRSHPDTRRGTPPGGPRPGM
ncbi:MAG: YgfD: protein that forms a complex with the methylmalonyl-CoA mutase in a pathway for conversion of succinyl-CoA to propionyl-CoA, partial [uncultured Pseudonocardia sp.]